MKHITKKRLLWVSVATALYVLSTLPPLAGAHDALVGLAGLVVGWLLPQGGK